MQGVFEANWAAGLSEHSSASAGLNDFGRGLCDKNESWTTEQDVKEDVAD